MRATALVQAGDAQYRDRGQRLPGQVVDVSFNSDELITFGAPTASEKLSLILAYLPAGPPSKVLNLTAQCLSAPPGRMYTTTRKRWGKCMASTRKSASSFLIATRNALLIAGLLFTACGLYMAAFDSPALYWNSEGVATPASFVIAVLARPAILVLGGIGLVLGSIAVALASLRNVVDGSNLDQGETGG